MYASLRASARCHKTWVFFNLGGRKTVGARPLPLLRPCQGFMPKALIFFSSVMVANLLHQFC